MSNYRCNYLPGQYAYTTKHTPYLGTLAPVAHINISSVGALHVVDGVLHASLAPRLVAFHRTSGDRRFSGSHIQRRVQGTRSLQRIPKNMPSTVEGKVCVRFL